MTLAVSLSPAVFGLGLGYTAVKKLGQVIEAGRLRKKPGAPLKHLGWESQRSLQLKVSLE